MKNTIRRFIALTVILLKEQIKEPIAFFWLLISPCGLFYLINLSRYGKLDMEQDYSSMTGWYYGYIASNVALFGNVLYLIGRRESGFVRSFVYTKPSRSLFLCSHLTTHTLVATAYCAAFYLLTRPLYGHLDAIELAGTIVKFLQCFFLFCSLASVLSVVPLTFSTANTLMSVFSFSMLGFGVAGAVIISPTLNLVNTYNPIAVSMNIMSSAVGANTTLQSGLLIALIINAFLGYKYFRLEPVWSRY